jgi:hypothetical protein
MVVLRFLTLQPRYIIKNIVHARTLVGMRKDVYDYTK